MSNRKGFKAYTGAVMAFLYLPILVLIVFSFNESKSRNTFTGFTFKWYAELFQNAEIIEAFGTTLLVAAIASIVSTLLGTAAAVGISNMRKTPRTIVMNTTYMPVINPEIVTGISMLMLFMAMKTLFAALGAEFSLGLGTLIIAHITFDVPYVILSVMPKLRQLDRDMYNAGLDLGCNPRQAFFKVVVPQIMPGILTGFLMALTYSIDDFVISYFTLGNARILSVEIYSMVRRKVSPQINAISTLLFVVVLALLLLMNWRDLKNNKKTKERT